MSKKYQKIYDKLYHDIQSHIFQNGDKLPSETQMMREYGVSRQTIRRVLSMLEDDGLIKKSRGSGSYVQYTETKLNTKQIAVLCFDLNISIFPSVVQKIDETLYRYGYTAAFYSIGGSTSKERAVLQHLIDTPVDGIIVYADGQSPICINLDLFQHIRKMGTKLLFFDSWYANLELVDIPSICIENYNGPYLITNYLIQRGYTRIGGFRASRVLSHLSRFSGICNAIVQNELNLDFGLFFEIAELSDTDLIKTPEGVKTLHSLDAFICTSGDSLPALTEALTTYGIGNLRTIVVFDEVPVPQIDGIEFIVFRHASLEIAELCVKKILDLINGLEVESIQVPWQLSKYSTAKILPTAFFK